MKCYAWVVVAGLAVGCGGETEGAKPERAGLAPGSLADVYHKTNDSAVFYEGKNMGLLAVGTRVRVIDQVLERTRINILEGEHKGEIGTIDPENLRPAPAMPSGVP